MLAHIPVAKASHMAKPRVNMGEDCPTSWMHIVIIATIYLHLLYLLSFSGNTLHLSIQVG